MKIVFLVINYMPHQLVSIKSLIEKYNVEVHSFNYKDNTIIPQNSEKFITYKCSDYNKNEILKKVLEINPSILVSAGWFVKDFVWIAKQIRKKLDIPVVVYSDTQWRGTLRQNINRIVSPLHLKKAFTHIWVAGINQFEYARKLGYKRNEIIFNALSCDVGLFGKVDIEIKKNKYPKNFLFIGRFIEIKGIDYLIKAWNLISEKKGWTLTLIGDGHLKNELKKGDDIIIKDFMGQQNLVVEMQNAGCFILPSTFEPWALVLHEAAAAGLPIIATDVCGATPHFVINGFNGYRIKPGSTTELKLAMEKIISMDVDSLIGYSTNSKKLALSITPEIGSANLLSIIKN